MKFPTDPRSIISGLVLALFVFGYYYFFTEKLPWFWYDDIQRVEWAENRTGLQLVADIFDLTAEEFGMERPVLQSFIKICLSIFGENPHWHRVAKFTAFCVALAVLFLMNVANGVVPWIALIFLTIGATFPSSFIVNSWIGEAATLQLLFQSSAFIIFLYLYSKDDEQINVKNLFLALVVVLLVLMADKSKAPAKLIPMVFISFLAIIGSRKPILYIVSLVSLLIVLPYGSLIGSRMGTEYARGFHFELIRSLWDQAGLLFLLCGLLAVLARQRLNLLRDRYVLFIFIWIVWEVLFFVFFPSSEIRYLFISLMAISCLAAAIASFIIKYSDRSLMTAATCFLIISTVIFVFVKNIEWSDNFRGSVGGEFVIADKKIKHINKNYDHLIAIYGNFTPLYYKRNTNNVFLNIHPRHEDNFSHIYKWHGAQVSIHNPDAYSSIIVMDENAPIYSGPPLQVFDSVIDGSMWDRFHALVDKKIKAVNLYNVSAGASVDYPQLSGIYALRQ